MTSKENNSVFETTCLYMRFFLQHSNRVRPGFILLIVGVLIKSSTKTKYMYNYDCWNASLSTLHNCSYMCYNYPARITFCQWHAKLHKQPHCGSLPVSQVDLHWSCFGLGTRPLPSVCIEVYLATANLAHFNSTMSTGISYCMGSSATRGLFAHFPCVGSASWAVTHKPILWLFWTRWVGLDAVGCCPVKPLKGQK